MNEPVTLTALLITLNGQRLLENCLQSLTFCDRIVIIDSFSTDRTEAIAAEHGALFIRNPWPGYAPQIRFGIDWLAHHAPSQWILFLDCDEICTPALQTSIQTALANPQGRSAFSLPRRTWYYDRFLKHGGNYPDRLFRLFRPEGLRMDEANGHPVFTPTGSHGALEGDLLHYTYSSFFNQMEKLNLYAQRGADELRAKGKRGGVASGLGHGLWRFVDMYLRRLGFLDGRAGLLMALHTAFYTFLKYIRIHEGNWGAPYTHTLPPREDEKNA